jgi:hypothetical protein
MEQRANIKFCFKTGRTATETFQLMNRLMVTMLSLVHGLLNGMQDFGTAMKISKMTKAVGRPTAVRTPDMIETVRGLFSTDRRMTLRMM